MRTWDRAKKLPNLGQWNAVPLSDLAADHNDDAARDEEDQKVGKKPRGGWIPLSLSTPVLLAFIVLSLLIAAFIEALAQISQAQDGLALSATRDEIPKYARISYRYGPTIVAVLYSLVWNWIDLDVKRMQPWLELSKPSGAIAKDSLLRDYPSDFVAMAPFTAAKLRHWAVFCSGTILVLILWVLTPLQSALLGISVTQKTQLTAISTRSNLIPVNEQMLNLDFTHTAYGINWLNQSYPPFTTPEYILLPFYIDESSVVSGSDTNLTAETTKIWSNLTCSPATFEKLNDTDTGVLYNFYGERGCNVNVTLYNITDFMTGYRDTMATKVNGDNYPYVCPDEPDDFYATLILWSQMFNDTSESDDMLLKRDITAIHCELTFHKQRVMASVSSQFQRPIDEEIRPLEDPSELSLKEFNSTDYISVLPIQSLDRLHGHDDVWDFTDTKLFSPGSRFADWNLSLPVDAIVTSAFALGDNIVSDTYYSDPSHLERVFKAAHQQLFALAVSDSLSNDTTPTNNTATAFTSMAGIHVSRPFTIVAETILVLIAVNTAFILWYLRSSPCALTKNPASIGSILDIGHNSQPDAVHPFFSVDTADEKFLSKRLQNKRFKLTINEISNESQLVLIKETEDLDKSPSPNARGYFRSLKLWMIRRPTGMLFVAILISSIIVLSHFKAQEAKNHGLLLPARSFEARQILEHYIPTIFAALISPVLVLLTRMLSIFQPFDDLWKGRSAAATSIDSTYAAVPPQLTLVQAIKSRHIMLSLLCIICLLANLLTVGLGALFNEMAIETKYQHNFYPLTQERFSSEDITSYSAYWYNKTMIPAPYDDLIITLTNLSSDSTSLPPWTSPEWFFSRHSIIGDSENQSSSQYQLETRGYGVNPNCTAMPVCTFSVKNKTAKLTEDNPSECKTRVELLDLMTRRFNGTDPDLEFPVNKSAQTTLSLIDTQTQELYISWLRSSPEPNSNESTSVNATFVRCHPFFETAKFNVTVDKEGYVLGYVQTSDLGLTLGYPESHNHTTFLTSLVDTTLRFGNDAWSFTNTRTEWMSKLIYLITGWSDLTDPTLPVPDSKRVLPVVENIYKRLFTAFLSMNPQLFVESTNDAPVSGTKIVSEVRVFMDNVAFRLSMFVLCANLVVIAAFYLRPMHYVLPRMPTSIGSILAYVAPSRALKDGTPQPGWKDQTFSFGRYIGHDGSSYIGIEMDPHVVQGDLTLGRQKTTWLFGK